MRDGAAGKTVLIIEERHSGHLLVFVRVIAERAIADGCRVELALGAGVIESEEHRLHLAALGLPTTSFSGPVTPVLTNSLAVQAAADIVVVPHGDELGVRVGLSRIALERLVVLLVMRDPRWERPLSVGRLVRNLVKSAALVRAAGRSNTTVVWLRHLGFRGRVRHVVDPFVPDGSLAEIQSAGQALRRDLGMSDDTFWFVVPGAITDRKNVPLIARCLSNVQQGQDRPIGLAVIGPHRSTQPIDARSLQGAGGAAIPIVNCDRMLTNFEMNAAVAAADAVVMAYDTHSPNSTMVKALALGSRLVVAGPPAVRGFARDMGWELVGAVNPTTLERLLSRALGAPQPIPQFDIASSGDFAQELLKQRARP